MVLGRTPHKTGVWRGENSPDFSKMDGVCPDNGEGKTRVTTVTAEKRSRTAGGLWRYWVGIFVRGFSP